MHEAAFHRLAEEIGADIEHARALLRRHVAFVREIRNARRFLLEWRYDPDQPRVPAGSPDGGQWTSGEASGETSQPQEMMRRGPSLPRGTPAQQMSFIAAKARADAAVARVMERDPTWRRPESISSTIEGQIEHQREVARKAGEHHAWLVRWGIGGPGQFAVESFPAPVGRPLNRAERDLNDLFGYRHGCNTCGTFNPGSRTGHWYGDHQPNTGWNHFGRSQVIVPQCSTCSAVQGGHIRTLRSRGGF